MVCAPAVIAQGFAAAARARFTLASCCSCDPHKGMELMLSAFAPERAGKAQITSGKMIAVLAPPPHYDHPYRGPVVEMVMPLAQARALCRKQGVIADACSWTKSGKCYLVTPRGGPVKGGTLPAP